MMKTPKMVTNRPALQCFMHPMKVDYDQFFWEEERNVMGNKIRNNLASIHAQAFVLIDHIDGFFKVINNSDIDVSDKVKKQAHDLLELRDALNVLKSKLEKATDSGMKIGGKDEQAKRNDAVDWNYDIVDKALKIVMDCEHDGSFNNNGKILVEMPESLFNTLKFPKYAIDQMDVFGSVKDRMDQFID